MDKQLRKELILGTRFYSKTGREVEPSVKSIDQLIDYAIELEERIEELEGIVLCKARGAGGNL